MSSIPQKIYQLILILLIDIFTGLSFTLARHISSGRNRTKYYKPTGPIYCYNFIIFPLETGLKCSLGENQELLYVRYFQPVGQFHR